MNLFGSTAGPDFEPGRSDVDLLVDFGSMDGYAKAHAYFDLLDELWRTESRREPVVAPAAT